MSPTVLKELDMETTPVPTLPPIDDSFLAATTAPMRLFDPETEAITLPQEYFTFTCISNGNLPTQTS